MDVINIIYKHNNERTFSRASFSNPYPFDYQCRLMVLKNSTIY